ncbi:TlpA family protein disulfide reductase [Sphingobacterium haloxyli]|uniref:Thioredoxin domain-containing protein n=1 Tax=Sphingobacterium haloxyli TaxID=2100533 RepID=A0A2S9J5H9_9SPHI|nr:TlpA disulfide reductase family protein [Sphingobacterium haloxyli]PRD48031.1 hypothetical protein C5745_05830 [Sphingobacterium haloxyli]
MQQFYATGHAMPVKTDRTTQVTVYPPRHIHNQNVFLQDPIKKIVTTRTGSITKPHTNLKTLKDEDSFKLPSATVRDVVDVSSRYPRDLFDTGSGAVREVFDCCSGATRRTTESQTKDYRSCPEPVPKRTRSAPEGHPNSTRRNRWRFCLFFGVLKAGIKYRCSKDVVLFTQLLRKIDEVTLMYRECTVSVRGVYRKGTGDLLRSYWRSTTDLLNACTSGVDQRYSKSRGIVGVEAMKNKSMPLVLALICFMLFNLSDAWAQSAESRTAEGRIEIKPLQVGHRVPDEFWTDSVSIYENGEITRATLSQYRGKSLLLDFWNTWCTTCIAHMPDLYQTKAFNKGDMNVLLVTNDDPTKVQTFFANKEIAKRYPLTSIVGNKTVPRYFVHGSVPFYVLLNGEGMVQTMTGLADLRIEDIERLAVETDGIRVSDVTTDTNNFPALLAQKYAAVPNFHYSYFFRGENSDLGGGNIRRMEDGKLYSLSMLNIGIGEMYRSIARYRYEELDLPFHHSFVQFPANLPILVELSSLEYSIPVSEKESVPLQALAQLNEHIGLNARFQPLKIPVRLVYDKKKPFDVSKAKRALFRNTPLSSAVRRFFNDGIPVFDISSADEAISVEPFKNGRSIGAELDVLGRGVKYIEVEFPILVVEL